MTSQPAFKEGRVEDQDLNLRYIEAGHGNSVVAVDPLVWGPPKLYQSLARTYRVIILQAPPLEDGTSSTKELAGKTAQAAASLVNGPYALLGSSVGAGLALWQALLEPGDIEALVLVSPIAILPSGGPPPATATRPAEVLCAHAENAAGLPQLDQAGTSREKALVQRIRDTQHDAEAESRLSEIQCATLAVFGLEDKMVRHEAARVYREKIPNGNISLVYDAGHLIEAERPDSLINLVEDFVERRETFIVGRRSTVINP